VKVKWRKATGKMKASVGAKIGIVTEDRSNGEKIRNFVIFKVLAKVLMVSKITLRMSVNPFKHWSKHTETLVVIGMKFFGMLYERFGCVRNYNVNVFSLGNKGNWLNKRYIYLVDLVVNCIIIIVNNIYEKN
jgi:hypothetical protein